MKPILLALALGSLVACEPPGLRVVNRSAEPWTHEAGFAELVAATAEDAARDWDADPSILDGWQIVVMDGLVDCGDGLPHTGCTDPGERTISVSTYFGLPEDRGGGCIEVLPIWHEVGHVALARVYRWDAAHTNPRWAEEPPPYCPAWLESADH